MYGYSTQNVNKLFSLSFERKILKREKLKVIITQENCDNVLRKGHVGFGNPHVYLKLLNKVWDIF
jgi:hypothetical protein